MVLAVVVADKMKIITDQQTDIYHPILLYRATLYSMYAFRIGKQAHLMHWSVDLKPRLVALQMLVKGENPYRVRDLPT